MKSIENWKFKKFGRQNNAKLEGKTLRGQVLVMLKHDPHTKAVDPFLYIQIYDTTTKGLLSSPQQRRLKLVETIFHMYEKMELFIIFKMTNLKFVCGLDHCKCTGHTSNKSGYLKSRYRSPNER